MKKLLILCCCLFCAAAFVACSDKQPPPVEAVAIRMPDSSASAASSVASAPVTLTKCPASREARDAMTAPTNAAEQAAQDQLDECLHKVKPDKLPRAKRASDAKDD